MDDIIHENQGADTISALTAELEALRREKQGRHLLDCAREGLRSRGLSAGFAPLYYRVVVINVPLQGQYATL